MLRPILFILAVWLFVLMFVCSVCMLVGLFQIFALGF